VATMPQSGSQMRQKVTFSSGTLWRA
jgi:hypothetical protein